jgi:hypothetical protein
MMDAPDTRKSSAITDHPFEPREGKHQYLCGHIVLEPVEPQYVSDEPISPEGPKFHVCNLAEAAHSETTVKR